METTIREIARAVTPQSVETSAPVQDVLDIKQWKSCSFQITDEEIRSMWEEIISRADSL